MDSNFCKALCQEAKFTGKHLCQSLFLNKVAALSMLLITLFSFSFLFDCFGCCTKDILRLRDTTKEFSIFLNEKVSWTKDIVFFYCTFSELSFR